MSDIINEKIEFKMTVLLRSCCIRSWVFQDVEANTVRLKEHGQDVLVLEKITSSIPAPDGTLQTHYK